MTDELIAQARAILRGNDRGGYAVPTARLYPFQWNWDSGFVAMGWATFDEARACDEIAFLLRGQWENGMVPAIVFHAPSDDYFPGPDVWGVTRTPPTTGTTQPPILAVAVRQMLEGARDAALAERETLLSAAEKRLAARVDELTALRARLEALEAARKDRDEANWAGLVKVYETMKPRDAAAIFNDLDLPVLLQVVDRMKEAKAAAVLAAMLPDRARQVTAELAQMRARANTVAPPAATSAPRGVPRVDTGSAVSPAGTRPETTPGTGAGAVPSGGRAAAAINGKGKT